MFGIGGGELALIIIVLLIFVGPDKLPQVAKTVGTGLRDLRRAANLAQSELKQGMEELTREVQGVTRDVQSIVENVSREPSVAKPEVPKVAPMPSDRAEAEEPDVLAQIRRRTAEERSSEAPQPWTLHTAPDELDDRLEAPTETTKTRAKPRFRVPTAEPLPGTKARGVTNPGEIAAAPVPEVAIATAGEPETVVAPEPSASDPAT